ncbi:hypothetical protein CYMTET_46953 [Cymbomonas tetramitiformis]|uniref:uDENN domain-containing protein n=1 Tax=Cymbomonas tetramitiformis TaxID=36881 RepID=A0AAE0BV89_9CHLO|nr:hypothetical protein CYMTET_46953 [Cymbomonas tetramitiformis]
MERTGRAESGSSRGSGGLRQRFRIAMGWKKEKEKSAEKNFFNPEELTSQKREWAKQHRESVEEMQPDRLFEHFIVAGLPSSADVSSVTTSAKAAKAARAAGANVTDPSKVKPHHGPSGPTYPAELLFQYPPGKAISIANVAQFCFPHGVEPKLLERTPSMSSLNEVIYGQAHLHTDDQSFVFLLKVGNNTTLYGVCVLVQEVVQRPPGDAGGPALPAHLQ